MVGSTYYYLALRWEKDLEWGQRCDVGWSLEVGPSVTSYWMRKPQVYYEFVEDSNVLTWKPNDLRIIFDKERVYKFEIRNAEEIKSRSEKNYSNSKLFCFINLEIDKRISSRSKTFTITLLASR